MLPAEKRLVANSYPPFIVVLFFSIKESIVGKVLITWYASSPLFIETLMSQQLR